MIDGSVPGNHDNTNSPAGKGEVRLASYLPEWEPWMSNWREGEEGPENIWRMKKVRAKGQGQRAKTKGQKNQQRVQLQNLKSHQMSRKPSYTHYGFETRKSQPWKNTCRVFVALQIYPLFRLWTGMWRIRNGENSDIQWGEQVFDTLLILQVFPLTKHVEVCNFYHRYTSTVRDRI